MFDLTNITLFLRDEDIFNQTWLWSLSWTFTIKTTYKHTEDKNLVWNQYTLFDSSRIIHSDCGSSPFKDVCQQANMLGEK